MNPNPAANPLTDLVGLHAAALSDLATVFPAAAGTTPGWDVRWYARVQGKIPTPAIYLDLNDFEPVEDKGTGQWVAAMKFEAFVFTDYQKPAYQILARLYAAQLASFLNNHTWTGIFGTTPIEVTGIYADRFAMSVGGEQYDCMRVEFQQAGTFSADPNSAGTLPTEIFLGIAPNVGPANINDYEQVFPQPTS
jgi:hypothetical protein